MNKGNRRRTLTRDEWVALAGKVRQVTTLMTEIEDTLSATLTVAGMKPYDKAFGKVQSLRSRLDSLAVDQHRTWPEASELFYGPEWTYHANWQ